MIKPDKFGRCPFGYIEVNGKCIKRHEVYDLNVAIFDGFRPTNSIHGDDIHSKNNDDDDTTDDDTDDDT